jgi:hypothetical protein
MLQRIVYICFLFSSVVYAQFNRFEAGVEAGPAFGKFWSPGTSTFYTIRTSFIHGTYFKYNPVKNFGVQTGVYLERVSTFDPVIFVNNDGDMMGAGTVGLNTDYVTFPLIGKFTVGKQLRANFSLGTFFSYMLRHAVTVDYGSVFPYGVRTTDYTNLVNRFNTGLCFGAGVDYVFFNQLVVGIEMRNQLGLYNLSRSTEYFRTNSLQLLFRLSWQFK